MLVCACAQVQYVLVNQHHPPLHKQSLICLSQMIKSIQEYEKEKVCEKGKKQKQKH